MDKKLKHCQIIYEDYFSKLLNHGYTETAAAEACAHYYLDGKPHTKGLTPRNRSIALWNCYFWQNVPAKCYELDTVAFALGRAIHSGLSDFAALERIIQIKPEFLKRGIRYSQVFLYPESPLWKAILKLSKNSSEDFRTFLKACDRLHEILKKHDKAIEKIQAQLIELTVFEFLLYGSLFAFQNLVSASFNKKETDERIQENSEVLNQILVWKIKTRPENDFRLNERFLTNSLKCHLIPLILPTERTPTLCEHNLALFTSLTKAVTERNNFWNRTITEFSFDDDYRYKFDGDHLTIYPVKIPKESDWDRNGKKLNLLHQYWLNRALIEYGFSELDDIPFGLPVNDAGNREAYIKSIQIYLQLIEIYGMENEVESLNGTRVDLFKTLHSLELMTAFFKAYYIVPFKAHHQTSGNWLNALGQLLMDGIAEGENRFPLTWAEPAEKAQRIKSWTVSDSHPQGDLKAAEAILSFWTNDLLKLADNKKSQPNIPVPEFHERPILQLGRYGFQLPWLMATQNNSTAAINNLRRIGCRRGGRKNETHRIEQRLGELFQNRNFTVVKGYQPTKTLIDDPGEIDLICFLDGHLFILEIKSTYIRKTLQDAWIHYTTTLRKAAQQLRRKHTAVLSAVENDKELRATLQIPDQRKSIITHAWIVDTSIEYDQAIIDGFLKVSLEGLTVILRNERYLLRGLIHENEDIPTDDLFREGFSAEHFAEIVEKGKIWSILDE
ncbi:MAG TPA: NERD domain-containing protein [Desulfobacterales bacterium]|nr:NERD domain-containing protein [Desulfobacterales bacterium]